MLRSALSLEGRGVIQLGIAILIATPIARVAFSVGAFAGARNARYVAITAAVLAVLGLQHVRQALRITMLKELHDHTQPRPARPLLHRRRPRCHLRRTRHARDA